MKKIKTIILWSVIGTIVILMALENINTRRAMSDGKIHTVKVHQVAAPAQ